MVPESSDELSDEDSDVEYYEEWGGLWRSYLIADLGGKEKTFKYLSVNIFQHVLVCGKRQNYLHLVKSYVSDHMYKNVISNSICFCSGSTN